MTVTHAPPARLDPRRWQALAFVALAQLMVVSDTTVVNIAIPSVVQHRQVRVLPLEGFDEVELAAMWHGEPTPLLRAVFGEMQGYVAKHWPQWKCEDKLPD